MGPMTSPSTAVFTRSLGPEPEPVSLPEWMVEAVWPVRLVTGGSGSIRLSLFRTGEDEFVPSIEVAGHIVAAVTPLSVSGTPEASIETAFDPECGALAIAGLEGAAFEIISLQPDSQALDKPLITWRWDILALESGRQVIDACVRMRWEYADGTGKAIERDIWCSTLGILVE